MKRDTMKILMRQSRFAVKFGVKFTVFRVNNGSQKDSTLLRIRGAKPDS